MDAERKPLLGTRLALMGAVLYLLEWAVIPFLPAVPTDRLGENPSAIVDAYAGEAGLVAFAAGWFGVVLVGRVLYMSALRDALAASARSSTLANFAVGAMAVSVAIEIASFGVVAAAGWLAENGADAGAVVALDAAGSIIYLAVFGTVGVSVLAASLTMLASGVFHKWLCWLGVLSGALVILGGVLGGAAVGATGSFRDLGEIPIGIGVLGFWIWMLATSIILWRHAPTRGHEARAGV